MGPLKTMNAVGGASEENKDDVELPFNIQGVWPLV